MKSYAFVLMFLIYYLYNNIHIPSMVVGTYHNVNFESSPVLLNSFDTLTLFENNEFYSTNLGHGTFELSYRLRGTSITFITEELQERKISRTWLGTPIIVMFADLNHHYKKINSKISITEKELKKLKEMKEFEMFQRNERLKKTIKDIYKERDNQNF